MMGGDDGGLLSPNCDKKKAKLQTNKTKYVLRGAASLFFFYPPHFSPAYLSPGGDGEDEINFSDHSLIKYRQRHRLSVRSQLFDQQMKSFQSCHHCHRNQTYLSWTCTSCGTRRTSQIRAFYNVIVAIQLPLAVFRISAAKPERGS